MLKAHFFLIFPLKQAFPHHCALCLPSTFLRLRKRRQSGGRAKAWCVYYRVSNTVIPKKPKNRVPLL